MGTVFPYYDVRLYNKQESPAADGEIGEIVIVPQGDRCPVGIFSGYLNHDRQYQKAWRGGVYHTGDSACRDSAGRYWFCGRFDDVIKTGGFRQYKLSTQPELEAVSHSLCQLLQLSRDQLCTEAQFQQHILQEDLARYQAFLHQMKDNPGQACLAYTLRTVTGNAVPVLDTVTSWREPDGQLYAESFLTVRQEKPMAVVPWGYLRCTCEKQPRIIDMSRKMLEILRVPPTREGEDDYLELCRENIFLILPMEERRRFAGYLERIQTEDIPVFGEMALLRCDGSGAHVFGWVTRGQNSKGEEELQAVCLDISDYYESRKERASLRYLNALKDVYDKIFQYDLGEGILKCLYDSTEARFRWLQNLPMQLEEVTEKWVSETVVPEEQQQVMEFFQEYCHQKREPSKAGPARITYHARSSSGEIRTYSGIFLQIDDQMSLYCCRCLSNLQPNDHGGLEENMQKLLMQFTDGIAGFQVEDGAVTPQYMTDNICSFFGRSREEWLPMMQKATPIRDFVSQSSVDYEKFEKLLEEGEAEFQYFDLKTHQEQRMKAICSHKEQPKGAARYVMLYQVEGQNRETKPHVYIRTFGYFDVFVDEVPIAFRNRKSKELFALLVDRKGGFLSSEEAIGYLWEDEPVNSVTLARYRKAALRLKNLLMEYGISDVVEAVDGKRRIIPQKVRCDLYDYLSGDERCTGLFKGSYLTNYSWGETTLAELTGTYL